MYIYCRTGVQTARESHDLNMECVLFDHCVKQLCIWIFMQEWMLNVRQADGHLYEKKLFTWLSLVMSLMASFCAVFFPTRCLG